MPDVRVAETGHLGHLTLDRPKALNALTQGMIDAIHAALDRWQDDDRIHAVLLDGAGDRAFCAGGDLRTLYDAVCEGDYTRAAAFLEAEFRLDLRLARFAKPVVTVMHGVTMGGGIGVGAHARHRIVTDTSKLGMPEVGIGYVPDVGGTWLLGRAPGELGTYAALTGATLGPADALAAGLADHFVEAGRLADLPERLSRCQSSDAIAAALRELASSPEPGPLAGAAWIEECFAGESVAGILAALEASSEPEARAAAERIAGNCPTSLCAALRALRSAPGLGSLGACLDQEFRIAARITRRPDFREGVRAAVIDKDRQPKWQPARVADVDPVEVEAFFAPLGADELGLG